MNLPELPPCAGALVLAAAIGPRRALTLSIELWPYPAPTFRHGEGPLMIVRFGGIANMEAVSAFWSAWRAQVSRPGLHYLRYAPDQPSQPGHLRIELEFDSTGDRLRINCQHLTVTPQAPG